MTLRQRTRIILAGYGPGVDPSCDAAQHPQAGGHGAIAPAVTALVLSPWRSRPRPLLARQGLRPGGNWCGSAKATTDRTALPLPRRHRHRPQPPAPLGIAGGQMASIRSPGQNIEPAALPFDGLH